MYCEWKGKGAHVFNVNRIKGQYLWFDAQSGRFGTYVEDYVKDMKGTGISVIKIDDKIINPEMCKAFNAKGTSLTNINARMAKRNNAPKGFFADVRSAQNGKQKAELLQSYIDDANNHFTKIERYSSKEGSIFSSYANQFDKEFKKGEMPKNLDMARKLAKKGYDVYMMPNPTDGYSFDFIIKKGNMICDIEGKAFNGTNTLDHLLSKGAKQSNRVLVDVIGNTSTNYIYGCVNKAFIQSDISEIWLFKGAKLVRVTRLNYNNRDFGRKFKRIWEK